MPTETSGFSASAVRSAAGIPDSDGTHDYADPGTEDTTPGPSDYEEHTLPKGPPSQVLTNADLLHDVESGGNLGGGEVMLDLDRESPSRGSLPGSNMAGNAGGGRRSESIVGMSSVVRFYLI